MAAVGNFSRIEAAREQSFYADATAEVARAQVEAQRMVLATRAAKIAYGRAGGKQ